MSAEERCGELIDATVDDLESKYEFLDDLGAGATAAVYLAQNRATGEEVAIKVMDVAALADDSVFASVHAEVSCLRAVRAHPLVVHLVEVVRDASSLAIVLEALTGGDLHGELSGGALTEDAARKGFAQVVLAVEWLHSHGFSHRDIKAENVVAAADGNFKLVDFGSSAKTAAGGGGLTGLVATAGYCAPEVVASAGYGDVPGTGEPYGLTNDLWSLGILLYLMLSRAMPFGLHAVRDEREALRRIAEGEQTLAFEPARAWERVSDEAKDLVRQLLTRDPSRRASWAALHAHPWMATTLVEAAEVAGCERPEACADASLAQSAMSLETTQRQEEDDHPTGMGSAHQKATDSVCECASASEVTAQFSALKGHWSERAIERRVAAAATAGERLKVILARRQRAVSQADLG